MIQDIAPHTYDNTFRIQKPEGKDFMFCIGKNRIFLRSGSGKGVLEIPRTEEILPYLPDAGERAVYLFSIDGDPYFLLEAEEEDHGRLPAEDGEKASEPGTYAWRSAQDIRAMEPMYQAFAAITALQLFRWRQSRRFCGRCGSLMKRDEKERMLRCGECGNMEYPKICPAVIIGVTDGSRILMSKYAGRAYKKYALLAGFTEIGETAEETVAREVMEEVGLKVKNIRYYKSQPWSFSDTLLLGFYCDLDGDGAVTLDREELALAEWFEREDIPDTASTESLTNEMIMRFKNGEV